MEEEAFKNRKSSKKSDRHDYYDSYSKLLRASLLTQIGGVFFSICTVNKNGF